MISEPLDLTEKLFNSYSLNREVFFASLTDVEYSEVFSTRLVRATIVLKNELCTEISIRI